jgi:hypothetical protein
MRLIAGPSFTASFDRYFSADLATLSSAHALRRTFQGLQLLRVRQLHLPEPPPLTCLAVFGPVET